MTFSAMLHPETETLNVSDMHALQQDKWQKQWEYVAANSEFYGNKLSSRINQALSLDDMQDVALTSKEDLRHSQDADYPYGDYITCTPDKVVRIHRTSGTTGKALILANSQRDVDIISKQGARGMWASGLRPSDRIVHCLNYQMWTGGVTDHMALEATGATVLPFGVGGTHQLIKAIQELGITAISCTPSYPALLEKILRNDFNLNPKDLGLRLALFGGEAGLDNMEFRQKMESTWGFGVRNANFGLSEMMSIMGSQCEHTTDLHFHSSDVVFLELLDPKTGQRLKIEDGARGELVCTHLEKECQPLIRYRTRDVLEVTGSGKCACGRSGFRFRVAGRTDDMFNVRGVNIFPSAIQKVIAGNSAVSSGHFRIVLDGPGPYDRIMIRIEAAEGFDETYWNGAAQMLETKIRETIGASAIVSIVPFENFPRTDGKTNVIERSKK